MNFAVNIFSLVQFLFTIVIGVYFWNMLQKQRSNKKAINKDSKKELEKLHKMRRRSLTKPLAEKIRPSQFSDIVGQEDGIKALQAAICGPNPQHVIIYGPPGIGKTAAARLVLEEARKRADSPFDGESDFVELDATTARFDERGIADPLIGSVHDPIYQGAGAMGSAGIPQPKPGAVTKAHGGVLFIDEIGELHHIQMNKLLKVLEDRKVFLDSSYYQEEDKNIPRHIHEIFQKGLPADFRLIGATTRTPQEIPPAIRSRCLEIFFNPLMPADIEKIVQKAIKKIDFAIQEGLIDIIKKYATNGREAVNMVQTAGGIALTEDRKKIKREDMERVIINGHYSPRALDQIPDKSQVGVVNGLAVMGANRGTVDQLEVSATKVGNSSGRLNITGVAQEEEQGTRHRKIRRKSMVKDSAENVITVVKKILDTDLNEYDIHIDFTSDAVVDGPSAGVTMAVALYSALTGKPVSNQVAMTGKISVNGVIRPIGGVVPKVRAAVRAGAKQILIPSDNWQDLFNSEEFSDVEIIKISTLKQALEKAIVKDALKENEELEFDLEVDSIPASVV
ncbi:ATP-dependent protease LonB [Halobacteroides halobius DSM 5150]|uniref:endopeptidase La n=1 Tax=Halobacteroides halobius (strain ATCC 35273 / DSM 5150 / MD-1) TaxID=748449 RepID=L0KBK8_HALHC|nr:ATP-dependent protease LonB [Halobacteroides halobius]AGB41925.1 ATP-dependent protease LonB [Halobacteroides halobius DSM 5150]